jgi:hypothetical protein
MIEEKTTPPPTTCLPIVEQSNGRADLVKERINQRDTRRPSTRRDIDGTNDGSDHR